MISHVQCFGAKLSPKLPIGRQTIAYTVTKPRPYRRECTYRHFHIFFSSSNSGITDYFRDKTSRRLDTNISNPIGITTQIIKDFFVNNDRICGLDKKFQYIPFESNPVSITDNFDELQVPLSHVSRSPKDTYYLSQKYISDYDNLIQGKYAYFVKNKGDGCFDRREIDTMGETFNHSSYKVLPTHTTAHLPGLLRRGITHAIYSGQVFRRDEIDSQHYPIFHQMDGFLLFSTEDLEHLKGKYGLNPDASSEDIIQTHLKDTIENLVSYLFSFVRVTPDYFDLCAKRENCQGNSVGGTTSFADVEKKWDKTAYFPFTDPSLELYIKSKEEWVEILGCGLLKKIVIENNLKYGDNNVCKNRIVGGWAFGIGLERLAMVLCNIADIRQFWETDSRFYRQYDGAYDRGYLPTFRKYSKNPPVIRDISFYLPNTDKMPFDESKFYTMARRLGEGYVESVEFVSDYYDPRVDKKSLCYRVTYRGFGENITNEFVNKIHKTVEHDLISEFGVELR